MKSKGHWLSSLLASFLLISLLVGCAGNHSQETTSQENTPTTSSTQPAQGSNQKGAAADTLKIGVIVAETGPASALGKPEAEVARLVKKQLDATEINGKKIELIVEDYETDDTNAVVIMKKLISEEGVAAVVGGTQTSTSVAIGGVALENNIPLVALGVLNDDQFNDYIVQAPQSNETVLQKAIDYLKANNIKTVAWINARDGFGQTGLPVFEKMAAENGIEIIAKEDFDAEANDMTVQLTKIRPKNPGAIIVWSRPPGAGIIAKNYKQLGFDVPMIQSHAVSNQGFLDQVGAEGEGVLVIGSKLNVLDSIDEPEQKQLMTDFSKSFHDEYGYDPGPFGGYAYDGIQMVLKAISEGHDTPEEITQYLQTISYKGVTGTYQMSPDNRNAVEGDGMAILRVGKNGWELAE